MIPTPKPVVKRKPESSGPIEPHDVSPVRACARNAARTWLAYLESTTKVTKGTKKNRGYRF